MDIERWNQVEPSGRIWPEEFERPEHLAINQVIGLGITRIATNRPMRFTKSRSGRVYHPQGDAIPPDAGSHASRSLHKWGLPETADGALATDFDFATGEDLDALVDLFIQVLSVRFSWAPFRWTGIGVYLDWRLGEDLNPGFHLDQRPITHSTMSAQRRVVTWLRIGGEYHYPFSWEKFQQCSSSSLS